jgi:hypothetical protein
MRRLTLLKLLLSGLSIWQLQSRWRSGSDSTLCNCHILSPDNSSFSKVSRLMKRKLTTSQDGIELNMDICDEALGFYERQKGEYVYHKAFPNAW